MSGAHVVWLLLAVVLAAAVVLLASAEAGFARLSRARADAIDAEGGSGLPDADRNTPGQLRRLADRRVRVVALLASMLTTALLALATIIAVWTHGRWGTLGALIALGVQAVVVGIGAVAIPKARALADLDRTVQRLAGPVVGLTSIPGVSALTSPLLRFVSTSEDEVEEIEAPPVSEGELLALAEQAAQDEAIDETEQVLIASTIAFGDTTVREVLVPRLDMITAPHDASVTGALELMLEHGYSRLPITGESVDDVVGIAHTKDLTKLIVAGQPDAQVGDHLRAANVVPETKHVNTLMREMQSEQYHMVIVVDEYGGTAGLATLEDLIEELVGEIVDEFDVEQPMIESQRDGSLMVNGRAPVRSVGDMLDVGFPEGEWSTIGGLIFSTLGHVPAIGETIPLDGARLEVVRTQGARIARVHVSKVESTESNDPVSPSHQTPMSSGVHE